MDRNTALWRTLSVLLYCGVTLSTIALAQAESRASAAPAVQELLANGIEPANPCADLVKECFAYSAQQFVNCLHVSAVHPFCEGSTLGKLVLKRWQMAPAQASLDGVHGLLGPRLINRECLKSFDSQLSAHLGASDTNSEVLGSLEQSLMGCSQEPPMDLLQP